MRNASCSSRLGLSRSGPGAGAGAQAPPAVSRLSVRVGMPLRMEVLGMVGAPLRGKRRGQSRRSALCETVSRRDAAPSKNEYSMNCIR